MLLVWPHEVEPWFHSWYRGRAETLACYVKLCGYTNSSIPTVLEVVLSLEKKNFFFFLGGGCLLILV